MTVVKIPTGPNWILSRADRFSDPVQVLSHRVYAAVHVEIFWTDVVFRSGVVVVRFLLQFDLLRR